MEFLKKVFSEDNGNPSFIRVGSGYLTILFTSAITFALVYTVFNYKDLLITLCGMCLSAVCAALGIKAYQKINEE